MTDTSSLEASTYLTPTDPLKADFRNFLWKVWKAINLPDPTVTQYDIAEFLATGPNKICIEAFRGVGKSFITAAFVVWCLHRNPQLKIMVVSASKLRSDNFVMFCQQIIELLPELHYLRARPDQRQSRTEFDVGPATPDQTASVFARGIDSQLTGGRADIIISDDVEVVNNSGTVDRREALVEKTKEYSAILKPLPTSRVIYLGTPQTEDSIYNTLPETFVKRIWSAQVPTEEQIAAYGEDLAPMVQKMYDEGLFEAPVDPERFDMDELLDRQAEYGSAGYQLQFMLNTKLSDEERFPLKLKDLIVSPVPQDKAPHEIHWLPNPDRALRDLPTHGMAGDRYFGPAGTSAMFSEYVGRVMSIDPSGRGKDETGYAVGFQLAGNIWIPEAGGLQGGYSEPVLKELVRIIKRNKVQTIVIESNFGDGMFARLLEPLLIAAKLQCEVLDTRSVGMKEHRILDILEPVVGSHRLIVDPSVVSEDDKSLQNYEAMTRVHKSLFHQMTHICREKGALRFDDRVDALAMLVGHFVEIMNQDAEQSEAQAYEEWTKAQLEKIHESPLNGPQNGSRMMFNSI